MVRNSGAGAIVGSLNGAIVSQDLSLWISFFFSLMIFSMLAGDNALSKLAQYILVGVAMGYLGALAIQHVLRPRLFLALLANPADPLRWLVLVLGGVLCIAGVERIVAQSPGESTQAAHWSALQRLLRTLGVIPAALLLGIGASVLLIGLLQGTLWPQFWHTARTGLTVMTTSVGTVTSLLLLLLTTATLLHWTMPTEQFSAGYPTWMRYLLRGWAGLGKRALWFAGGVLFARLFASHLSLLIARLQFFLYSLEQSILWEWADRIWRGLVGG